MIPVDHPAHLGLLQHYHLADQDVPRIARTPPRKVAKLGAGPGLQRRNNLLRPRRDLTTERLEAGFPYATTGQQQFWNDGTATVLHSLGWCNHTRSRYYLIDQAERDLFTFAQVTRSPA